MTPIDCLMCDGTGKGRPPPSLRPVRNKGIFTAVSGMCLYCAGTGKVTPGSLGLPESDRQGGYGGDEEPTQPLETPDVVRRRN